MCKVSIIIPCYNMDFKLVNRCLASIEAQTCSDYEVIVVDDGSAPGFAKVLEDLGNAYSNVSIYRQENKGVSAARNYGLEKAQGKYIVFADADDYLTPAFLEEAVETAEANEADIVMGMNVTTYSQEMENTGTSGNKDIDIYAEGEAASVSKWMLGSVLRREDSAYLGQGPWNRLVDRNLAASVPFDEKLAVGEDIVWNLQLLQKCGKVCVVNRVWYVYYMNPGSSSRKYRENAIQESYDSLMKMKKYLDLRNDDQYLSYCLRCWSDLKRIYRCYLSHDENNSMETKRLFKNDPWNVLASKRFKKLSGNRFMFMRLLYMSKLLFHYYKIKERKVILYNGRQL